MGHDLAGLGKVLIDSSLSALLSSTAALFRIMAGVMDMAVWRNIKHDILRSYNFTAIKTPSSHAEITLFVRLACATAQATT